VEKAATLVRAPRVVPEAAGLGFGRGRRRRAGEPAADVPAAVFGGGATKERGPTASCASSGWPGPRRVVVGAMPAFRVNARTSATCSSLPLANACRLRLRAFWLRSPCNSTVGTPASVRRRASALLWADTRRKGNLIVVPRLPTG
jgi:hypothetical protein